jgi:hypothetical protein
VYALIRRRNGQCHGDGLHEVEVARTNLRDEGERRHVAVLTREPELVPAVENLSAFNVDLLAGTQETEIDTAAAIVEDLALHDSSIATTKLLVSVYISRLSPEFDGFFVDKDMFVHDQADLSGEVEDEPLLWLLRTIRSVGKKAGGM